MPCNRSYDVYLQRITLSVASSRNTPLRLIAISWLLVLDDVTLMTSLQYSLRSKCSTVSQFVVMAGRWWRHAQSADYYWQFWLLCKTEEHNDLALYAFVSISAAVRTSAMRHNFESVIAVSARAIAWQLRVRKRQIWLDYARSASLVADQQQWQSTAAAAAAAVDLRDTLVA